MSHKISDELIANVINSLKQIDVRGFDSMNILVGLVLLFDGILKSPAEEQEEKKEEEEE